MVLKSQTNTIYSEWMIWVELGDMQTKMIYVNQYPARVSFLENFLDISLLDLDLKAFSFHFSFSKGVKGKLNSLFNSRKE